MVRAGALKVIKSDKEIKIEQGKMYKRKLVQVEMIIDRGYKADILESDALVSFDIFRERYKKNNYDMIYEGTDKRSLSVIYEFKKYSDAIKKIKKQYEEYKELLEFIVISDLKKDDVMYEPLKMRVEFFTLDYFAFNVTRHSLTQYHEVMTNNEKDDLLQSSKLTSRELPGIPKEDVIIRYFNAQQRNVIFISRKDMLPNLVDTVEYYREVREIPIISSLAVVTTEEILTSVEEIEEKIEEIKEMGMEEEPGPEEEEEPEEEELPYEEEAEEEAEIIGAYYDEF